MVSCEGAASVPDHELVNEIRLFDSDLETDPGHRIGIILQEDWPILDSHSESNDATVTYEGHSLCFAIWIFKNIYNHSVYSNF